jgi:3alpha(or 20beta)-hydroxysteroid dehydrogenase
MGKLKDKVTIITGAASGMGATHAQRFIEEGAKVIIADISDKGKEFADELGEDALFARLDVTNYDDWKKVVEKTENEFGPIDVLVNNAGVSGPGLPISEITEEDYQQVIDVNQSSVF